MTRLTRDCRSDSSSSELRLQSAGRSLGPTRLRHAHSIGAPPSQLEGRLKWWTS